MFNLLKKNIKKNTKKNFLKKKLKKNFFKIALKQNDFYNLINIKLKKINKIKFYAQFSAIFSDLTLIKHKDIIYYYRKQTQFYYNLDVNLNLVFIKKEKNLKNFFLKKKFLVFLNLNI